MKFAAAFGSPLAALILAALPAASSFDAVGARDDVDTTVTRARALVDAKDYAGAVTMLQDRLRREAGDASAHELLGNALFQLGRMDEAAHHLEIAVRRFQSDGKDDKARTLIALLHRADPLASRREAFLKKAVDTLTDSAEELMKAGHAERALEILERLPPAATPGKDTTRVEGLLETVRAQFREVHLDEQSAAKPASGEWPLFEFESDHYRFACHLEPDVVKRLGTVMDDIFAFYVQVYFDGNEKKAASAKPLIKVHPNKASMLKDWSGGSAPEGWWSPGDNEVITFDTRTQEGTLDAMLVTLFHEASHQFMTLLSSGGYTPAWLNEGTASFFEGTVAMADGRVLWPGAALSRLSAVVYEMKQPGSPTARSTVSYAGAGSYGAEYYAFGWGLCYFLQQYEDATTLEYVYRPLYAEYRTKVIKSGGEPMKVFEEVFLGKNSPLGHKTFDDFERDWKKWIVEYVQPLNGTDAVARKLRMTRVETYLFAAGAAKAKPKSEVNEAELLRRALGDVEYVRAKIDKEEHPDGELLVMQADLLERLKRPAGAAPLLEQALDLADAGKFEVDAKRYELLEARLAKLDRKNAALRAAKSRVSGLERAAAGLLSDYRAAKEKLLLRSYTFAAIAGAALKDDRGLLVAATDLRKQARDAQLLLGTIKSLGTKPERWDKVLKTPPNAFSTERGVTFLDCVRSAAYIDREVPVTGEYELRARLVRTAPPEPGSVVGFVIAGNPEGDWAMTGVDERGVAGTWNIVRTGHDGTSLNRPLMLYPKPPIDVEKPIDLVVHVGRDGRVEIKIGSAEALVTQIPLDSGVSRHVGVFAKNAAVRFENLLVEIYP